MTSCALLLHMHTLVVDLAMSPWPIVYRPNALMYKCGDNLHVLAEVAAESDK